MKQTPLRRINDAKAKREALMTYAAGQERFAEAEQMHRLLANPVEAEGAHAFAVRLLRAYVAECDDPEPKPPCDCALCRAVYVQ